VALSLFLTSVTVDAKTVDRIAGIAGEHVVFLSDVRMRARVYMASQPDGDALARARQEAKAMRASCEDLIDEALVAEEAERRHLQVTEDEVSSAIDAVARTNETDRASLMKMIRERGIVERDYRAMVRARVLDGKLLALVMPKDKRDDLEAADKTMHDELRAQVYVEDRIASAP